MGGLELHMLLLLTQYNIRIIHLYGPLQDAVSNLLHNTRQINNVFNK